MASSGSSLRPPAPLHATLARPTMSRSQFLLLLVLACLAWSPLAAPDVTAEGEVPSEKPREEDTPLTEDFQMPMPVMFMMRNSVGEGDEEGMEMPEESEGPHLVVEPETPCPD
jgi:hypothetical protein